MEFKEITDLIKLVSKSNLIELRLKEGDFEISIKTNKHGKSQAKEASSRMQQFVSNQPPASGVLQVPLVQTNAEVEAPEPKEDEQTYLEIRSPMVGTFYRSASPDKPPYLKVGDMIEQGSAVCIIEAMKLFNEIESEISGKMIKVMVEDATPVEYDQVLFLVEP